MPRTTLVIQTDREPTARQVESLLDALVSNGALANPEGEAAINCTS